jgi:hypothetical protein
MALQQINWLQIDTANVPSGAVVDLGAISSSLHAVYADNLYVSGQTIANIIAGSGTDALNQYTSSLNQALELTGSNLTVKGNLLVKGTTTAVNSTTVAIGDNIIELNGSSAANGGLLIKDPTNPNTVSGSLLWDTTNDYWIAGQLGSEEKIVLISQLNNATASLSTSINSLSSSVDNRIDILENTLNAGNIWSETGSYYTTTNDLQVTGSIVVTNGISGSFTGNGSGLYNVPASGVTGLNLSQIADGSATASISDTLGLRVNRNTEITGSLIVSSGSALFNSSVTAENSDLVLTSGSGLYIRDDARVEITGSVVIKGDLKVEGTTTLVQTIDSNVESLIVSGAMNIVENQINAQVVKASLTIQNLGTLADRSNNSIIDCGDSFF